MTAEKPAPAPSRPAHDHAWDEGCTIHCPWRQYLIRDVTAKADGAPTGKENNDA